MLLTIFIVIFIVMLSCRFEGSGGVPFTQLELLEATHRGLHKFVPRHHDEIDLEIGDPIYVQKEADDLWCEGSNTLYQSFRDFV